MNEQVRSLEADNQALRNKLLAIGQNEDKHRRQVEELLRRNENLLSQVSLTKQQRMRLRNAVIGVIDDDDRRASPAE